MVSLVLLLLAAACGASEPRRATLHQVAGEQQRYEGKRLLLAGFVREFEDVDGARYFVLEDEALNRVLLRPPSSAVDFAGTAICIEGRFGVSESAGRTLEIDAIQPLEGARCPPA